MSGVVRTYIHLKSKLCLKRKLYRYRLKTAINGLQLCASVHEINNEKEMS